jgi:hypothetical protein
MEGPEPDFRDRRTTPDSAPVEDAVHDQPRFEYEDVRDHRVVVGVGVLLDVQIALDGPARIGQGGPLRAERRTELLGECCTSVTTPAYPTVIFG